MGSTGEFLGLVSHRMAFLFPRSVGGSSTYFRTDQGHPLCKRMVLGTEPADFLCVQAVQLGSVSEFGSSPRGRKRAIPGDIWGQWAAIRRGTTVRACFRARHVWRW